MAVSVSVSVSTTFSAYVSCSGRSAAGCSAQKKFRSTNFSNITSKGAKSNLSSIPQRKLNLGKRKVVKIFVIYLRPISGLKITRSLIALAFSSELIDLKLIISLIKLIFYNTKKAGNNSSRRLLLQRLQKTIV